MVFRSCASAVWLLLWLVVDVAHAADDKPWARGVSPAEQAVARGLLAEGNRLFEESQYVPALEKYRQALPHWDHPLIRYNIAVCLVNLDQAVDGFDNLERALAFGEAPLGPEIYARAQTYRKLLLGQLAELKVRCDEQGAVVTFDGKPLFIGPGTADRWVLPGPHQLVVKREGYVTLTHELVLLPHRPTTEELHLVRQGTTVLTRRWPQWKPWVVFGAGLLVAAIGVPLEVVARSDLAAYDRTIAASCPTGCSNAMVGGPPIPGSAQSQLDRANGQHAGAIAAFSVGGALVAAGAVLLVLNAPRGVSAPGEVRRASRVRFAPGFAMGPGFGGATLSGAF